MFSHDVSTPELRMFLRLKARLLMPPRVLGEFCTHTDGDSILLVKVQLD